MDVAYHLVLAPLTVVGVLVGRRARISPLQGLVALMGGGLVGVVLGRVLAGDLFHFTRLMAWLFFLYVPLQLLCLGALLWGRRRRVAVVSVVTALGIWVVALDAFLVEPRWLEISRFTIVSNRVAQPLRVAVLADLQTDQIGAYERRVFERLKALEPDIVLMPGDYLQLDLQLDAAGRAREAPELRRLLQDLDPILGVFAVRGNVEPPDWQELFAGTSVVTLDPTQSRQPVEWLTVTGLSVRDSFDRDLRLPRARDGYNIVFGHGPDFALGEIEADLLLAGHTHGGQVRLPIIGPLLTLSAVPRAWAAGLSELSAGKALIVSRGVGMERGRAPRLRFLCRPELVIVELLPG
jgi:hypothetical protein